jgi:hypothetical protein
VPQKEFRFTDSISLLFAVGALVTEGDTWWLISLRCICIFVALTYPCRHAANAIHGTWKRIPERLTAVIFVAVSLIGVGAYGWAKWPETRYERRVLRQMDSQQLRSATAKLSNKLNVLELEWENGMEAQARQNKNLHEVIDKTNEKYLKIYFPDVCNVRDELLWRLGRPVYKTFVNDGTPPALDGSLIGPRPLQQAAQYLTDLANQL